MEIKKTETTNVKPIENNSIEAAQETKSSDNTFDNKFDQGITSNNKILQFLAGSPLGIWGIPVAIIIIGVIVYALFQ